ncbi:LysR substrate-binding domain-containing protein [Mucilaginibacter sp. cycad4]|uniref:LysR substrate-binding domain-containing protein n=1 Tax=Mucilaginibacter sp. cycad4 TaxID=3342096 RepID=UPI002AAAE20B|nr:LysR substrate-binding domain-containing protein [Mucilaginibacter gossypii]WPU99241.1 LysR substrate-binding domain-containing protein [Mucilaginibacter gossypii]
MELRQLKYFIKAAELQNFTDAAAAVFITQSTLSQQIKQLEDELQLPLFDRVAKRVRLTEAGKSFLPYAQKTVRDAEEGRDMLKDLMNLQSGTLTVGTTYGLTNLLTKAVLDFSAKYPNIKLQIGFGTTQDLLTQLEQGRLDMMLSFMPEQQTAAIQSERIFSSCLALIVHSDHLLAQKKQVNLRQLSEIPLLLPSAGYSIRNYLDSVLLKHQVAPNVKMEVNDIHMLLQLVDTGRWATVLMGSSAFNHPSLKAIKITGAGMAREATIAWPRNAYRKRSALALAQNLTIYATDYHVDESDIAS